MKNTIILGDTHGDFRRLSMANSTHVTNTTFIVCGDFGFVWDNEAEHNINRLSKMLTMGSNELFFVDGNHENFNLLYQYPVEEFCGGKVHTLAHNIKHLMRGQIFNINGRTFFTMGGANSVDKPWRTPYRSWWPEEDITVDDMKEARANLEKVRYMVDYVLSHTCPLDVKFELGFKLDYDNHNEGLLQQLSVDIMFKDWFFGHMHTDGTYFDKYHCLYNSLINLASLENSKSKI